MRTALWPFTDSGLPVVRPADGIQYRINILENVGEIRVYMLDKRVVRSAEFRYES